MPESLNDCVWLNGFVHKFAYTPAATTYSHDTSVSFQQVSLWSLFLFSQFSLYLIPCLWNVISPSVPRGIFKEAHMQRNTSPLFSLIQVSGICQHFLEFFPFQPPPSLLKNPTFCLFLCMKKRFSVQPVWHLTLGGMVRWFVPLPCSWCHPFKGYYGLCCAVMEADVLVVNRRRPRFPLFFCPTDLGWTEKSLKIFIFVGVLIAPSIPPGCHTQQNKPQVNFSNFYFSSRNNLCLGFNF